MPPTDPYDLQRFIDAQQDSFAIALAELSAGEKRTHWMWFVFPQIAGLGHSPTARYYAIQSLDEARVFLAHPLLGPRLRRCAAALLQWAGKRSAEQILGSTDAMKLRSSLTLFDQVEPHSLFAEALFDYYHGQPDERTLELLNAAS